MYRTVFERAFEFLWVLTPGGRLREANLAALEFIGRGGSDVARLPFWEAPWWSGASSTREWVRGAVEAAAASGFVRGEVEAVGAAGVTVVLDLSLKAVRDDSGAVVMLIGEGRDVTDRKRAEGERDDRLAGALEGSRAKSRFLAEMSHEIRNPMNGVLGMTALLLETPLDATQRAYAAAIQGCAEALLTVLDDALDVSRIEAGKLALGEKDFAVGELIEGVVDLHAPRAHGKGLEIACRVPPGFPEHLRGDPARLGQVLSNLVGNAVKFTDRGRVVVEAESLAEGEAGVTFRLSVRDTGVGIPAGEHDAVFESYHQLGAATPGRDDGSGLGLAICRTLATLMGGRIGLDSGGEGRGATFWLELTLPHAAAAAAGPAGPPEALRGRKVLVAGAGAATRAALCEHLAAWGCRVEEAATGAEALDRLDAARAGTGRPFDLAVLDHQIVDGLRDDSRWAAGLPVVLLSPLGVRLLDAAEPPGPEAPRLTLTRPVRRGALREAVLAAVGVTVTKPEPAPARPASFAPLHVLVAEDHEVNRVVAVRMLDRYGCRADTVANGREALESLTRPGATPYDLILMDVQMPEMDGLAATAEIRRAEAGTGRRVPIIAMTANAMAGDRDVCLSAGMDGCLHKPVRPEALLAALLQWGPCRAEREPEPPASFSRDALRESCGGDSKLQAEILRLFQKEATRAVAAIKAALADGQARELARLAHGLRGSCLLIGAEALGQLTRGLESRARNGDLQGALALAADLDGLWERLRDDLCIEKVSGTDF